MESILSVEELIRLLQKKVDAGEVSKFALVHVGDFPLVESEVRLLARPKADAILRLGK